MWFRLIPNNERTESQMPWSSAPGTLISVSDRAPASFPGWQQVRRLRCFRLFGSPSWIGEDFLPSYGHLVSSWSTGGRELDLLLFAPALPLNISPPTHPRSVRWNCSERGLQNKEVRAIWQALAGPAKLGCWRPRQAVWFLSEYWWWHRSRSPPVPSSSDLCSQHAAKG